MFCFPEKRLAREFFGMIGKPCSLYLYVGAGLLALAAVYSLFRAADMSRFICIVSELQFSEDGRHVIATRLDAERAPVARKYQVGIITQTISELAVSGAQEPEIIEQENYPYSGYTSGFEFFLKTRHVTALGPTAGSLFVQDLGTRGIREFDLATHRWAGWFGDSHCVSDFFDSTPDRSVLAVGHGDTIDFWNTSTEKLVSSVNLGHISEQRVAMSSSGYFGATDFDRGVQLFDLRNGPRRVPLNLHDDARCLAQTEFTKDGDSIAILSNEGVVLYDLKRLHARKLGPTKWGKHLCFSPDGTKVAGVRSDGTILVVDAVTSAVKNEIRTRNETTAMAWSPDSTNIAMGDELGSVSIWDSSSPAISASILAPGVRGHHHRLQAISFAVLGLLFLISGKFLARVGSAWEAARDS
jgi:WD40 repeat protein